MSYLGNLFVSLDQLGNTLAGGNPDNTISARIGFFNHRKDKNKRISLRWKTYRKIVDWAFEPIDGEGHCHEAYHNDAGENYDKKTKGFAVVFISIFIIPICIVIGSILHLLLLLHIVSPKKIDRTKNIKKRITGVKNKLNGMLIELNENEVSVDEELMNLTNEAQTILGKIEKKINKTEKTKSIIKSNKKIT